jgi:glycosyltransferase involved in cell wall biosynthesis
MRDAIAARGLSTDNVEILNNFQLQSFDGEGSMPEGLEKPEGSFRILFAGNLGRFQGLETILEAMALLDDLPAIRLDLLGDGVGRISLEQLAGSRLNQSVFFHGYQPVENTVHVIKTCDLGLIALNPDIYRHAYPSKTMTYLGVGASILLVIEAESELAQMVARERIGYHVAQNNPEALAAVIRQAYIERAELDGMRMRSKALAERSFTAEAVLPRWSELVKL